MVQNGLAAAINADKLLSESGLIYTTLRFPWLNDRDEVKYTITHKTEQYVGVSGSRQSMADVIVKIIADPEYLKNDSVGIADADTQGKNRPVYYIVKTPLSNGNSTTTLSVKLNSFTPSKTFLKSVASSSLKSSIIFFIMSSLSMEV